MIRVFFKILIKSIKVIKSDPIILAPFLMFNLFLSTFTAGTNFIEDHQLINAGLQWLIPTIIIQPFIYIVSFDVIQKRGIEIQNILNKYKECIWCFFIGSIHTPLMYYGGTILMNHLSQDPNNLSMQDTFLSLSCIGVGFIFSILTIYFYAYVISVKNKQSTLVIDQLLASIRIFLNFKWVSVSFILYYFIFLSFGFLVIIGIFNPLIPTYYQPIFISLLYALIGTTYNVFLLRLFLYIKPLFNLNYS